MLRFFYVIILNLWRAAYLIPMMRYRANRPEKYSIENRYSLSKVLIHHMQKTGHIHTTSSGAENLPEENGYVMYSNHQGKYDSLGIIDMHERPLSLVMDEARSHTILVTEFLDLLDSKRLKKDNLRQGMQIMMEITRELKAERRNFLIFPEGGYENNHNRVCRFKGGSFKCAMKAKVPIVPVAIIDSFKVFEGKSLRRVDTQVHFLKPLYYDDYKNMTTKDVAAQVQRAIQNAILDHLTGPALEALKQQLAQPLPSESLS